MSYVGRLAPSPTGRLHLGIARTSLLAWLDARTHEGRLILRIEDVDQTRCRPEMIPPVLEDLRWLGLDWDVGPDRPGSDGPYLQSERAGIYGEALERLTSQGRIYPCTCSRKDIARAASAPHGPQDEGPRYPEICRDEFRPRPNRNPALRFRTETGDVVHHFDRRFNRDLSQDVRSAVGDFVVRRTDGHWAYQLAVTVDDALQGVSCIVRGEDLSTSTGRQLLLRRVLFPDAPPLSTLHVPLLRDDAGQRIAKRTGGHTIAEQRAAGVEPETIVGRLAASVGLLDSPRPLRPADLLPAWTATDRGAALVDRGLAD